MAGEVWRVDGEYADLEDRLVVLVPMVRRVWPTEACRPSWSGSVLRSLQYGCFSSSASGWEGTGVSDCRLDGHRTMGASVSRDGAGLPPAQAQVRRERERLAVGRTATGRWVRASVSRGGAGPSPPPPQKCLFTYARYDRTCSILKNVFVINTSICRHVSLFSFVLLSAIYEDARGHHSGLTYHQGAFLFSF